MLLQSVACLEGIVSSFLRFIDCEGHADHCLLF